jgi:hypothetical protein
MTKDAYIKHLECQLAEHRRKEKARKERNIITAGILALTLAVTTPIVIVSARDNAQMKEWEQTREVKLVHVESGDSLDEYWAEYAPSWMNRYDYREAIKELNDMDSCALYAGDIIKVYTEGGK